MRQINAKLKHIFNSHLHSEELAIQGNYLFLFPSTFWDYLNIQFFVKLRPSSFFQSLIIFAWVSHSYDGCQMVPFQLYHSFHTYSLSLLWGRTSLHLSPFTCLYQHWVMDFVPSGGTGCFKIPPDLPWLPLLGSAIYPRIPSSFWLDNCCS